MVIRWRWRLARGSRSTAEAVISATTSPEHPATPADLAKAVDSLATTLEDLAVNYLAGATALVQDPLRHNLDGQLVDVDGRCK